MSYNHCAELLVVEDELPVLMLVEDLLTELGCEVVASASRLGPAMAAVGAQVIDAAFLDINIAGEMVYPVAEALAARQVPIVFSTGYGVAGVLDAWRQWPILQKPYRLAELACALKEALGRGAPQSK